MSMLKTRFKRLAQVIEARFSAGVWSAWSAELGFLRLPRQAGVTFERYLLFGANTPWKRVRLTLGFGISATILSIKSNGSNMTEYKKNKRYIHVEIKVPNNHSHPSFN